MRIFSFNSWRSFSRLIRALTLNLRELPFPDGLMAGSTLSRLFVSPQELKLQRAIQRTNLQSQADKYTQTPEHIAEVWRTAPILTGKRASERRHTATMEVLNQERMKFNDLTQQISAFDQQSALIDERTTQAGQSQADILAESPAYKYAAQLTDRALAARGQMGSGEAIKQHGGLAAAMFGQQTQGLQNLYGTGATAAGAMTTGAIRTGEGAAQAQMFGGQGQAQGLMAQGQAWQQGMAGVGSAIGGGINAGVSVYNTQTLANTLAQANQAPQSSGWGNWGNIGQTTPTQSFRGYDSGA